MSKHHPAHSSALSRRHFVAGVAAAAATPLAIAAAPPAVEALAGKRLIVLTLFGGNDGLNTLVPYRDPLYRKLRPTLALPADQVLTLNDELALHPALAGLAGLYEAGELALLPDVGYAEPELSHFESIAIWESGERKPDARGRGRTGWWAKVVDDNRAAFEAARLDAAAISFEPTASFASGAQVPVLHVRQDMASLFAPIAASASPQQFTQGGAAQALSQVVAEAAEIRARVLRRLAGVPRPVWGPSEDAFHVQARLTAWFLESGVTTPLVRMELGGFDHHTQLLPRHQDRLTVLNRELLGLRERLRAAGLWQDTVILVHSEFGRRPAENGFAGTDHGTAGPVMVLGGGVKGGVWGARAPLDRLDDAGNLAASTDFRTLYAAMVTRLFALPANPFAAAAAERAGWLA